MARRPQEVGHGRDYAVRWRNFRGFVDTGWIRLRPLTVLIGPNNSGKSSLIAPILMMKQSLLSRTGANALVTRGEYLDCGTFRDFVRDHDPATRVTFQVLWHCHADRPDAEPIGAYPPGGALFAFEQGEELEEVRLSNYEVVDVYGRRMLRRNRRKTGKYSLHLADLPEAQIRRPSGDASSGDRRAEKRMRSAMNDARPVDFLFTSRAVRIAGTDPEGEPHFQSAIDDDEIRFYCAVVDHTAWSVEDLFEDSTKYLGPLRTAPRRVYELSGEMPADVGTHGENAPEILYRWRDTPELLGAVGDWLQRFGFANHLDMESTGTGGFSLRLRSTAGAPFYSLIDAGFGLSQVLPLIVQSLKSDPGDWLITEQPEIHLNPRLQSALADLCVESVSRKLNLIVETHSEHFLLRLRRLVAEGDLSAADVALYFIENASGASTVREVPIDEAGRIEPATWPEGFFADSLREALALAHAQAEARTSSDVVD